MFRSPHRDARWHEPNYFLCSHYVPYAHGGGYVITRDLVEYVVESR